MKREMYTQRDQGLAFFNILDYLRTDKNSDSAQAVKTSMAAKAVLRGEISLEQLRESHIELKSRQDQQSQCFASSQFN